MALSVFRPCSLARSRAWRRRPFAALLSAVLSGSLGACPAAAQPGRAKDAAENAAMPSKAECAQAFETAQRLRNAARYLDADRDALLCASPACGAALSEECGRIHDELQIATPSVVFAARDASGNEVSSVNVHIDELESEVTLDGKPVALDPGKHVFVFRAPHFREQTEAVVIRAGEHLRAITIVLAPDAEAAPKMPSEQPETRTRRREPVRAFRAGPPWGVYALGGVALVGVGGFAGFRWWGAHDFDDLSRTCKPDCSAPSVDGVRQKYVISNVSLAIAGAATVSAVTWYLATKSSPRSSAARLQLGPAEGGIAARLSAPF